MPHAKRPPTNHGHNDWRVEFRREAIVGFRLIVVALILHLLSTHQ